MGLPQHGIELMHLTIGKHPFASVYNPTIVFSGPGTCRFFWIYKKFIYLFFEYIYLGLVLQKIIPILVPKVRLSLDPALTHENQLFLLAQHWKEPVLTTIRPPLVNAVMCNQRGSQLLMTIDWRNHWSWEEQRTASQS